MAMASPPHFSRTLSSIKPSTTLHSPPPPSHNPQPSSTTLRPTHSFLITAAPFVHQVFCGLWVLLLAFFLEVTLKPYAVPNIERLERLSICCLLISLSLFGLFLWDMPTWLEVVVVVLLFVSILLPLSIFAINICRQVCHWGSVGYGCVCRRPIHEALAAHIVAPSQRGCLG